MSLELLTKQSSSSQPEPGSGKKRAPRTLPTWFFPLIILLGFVGVFALVLWDDLKPATPVRIARAEAIADSAPAIDAEAQKKAPAHMLFQASGWIAPDPLETRAGTLISGTVKDVLVTEGELVEKGQTLVTFIDDDFRIHVDQTHADHQDATATVQLRKAELDTARANLAAQQANLAADKERLKNLEINHERYSKLGRDLVSDKTITDALHEKNEYIKKVEAAGAVLAASNAAIAECEARLASARAQEAKAEQACNQAKLDLSRCEIKSPIKGRVLRLFTSPGSRLNTTGEGASKDIGTAVSLYDPEKVALSMDVPLDQATKMYVGQNARIHCETFPDRTFKGIVSRIYGEADQQRNTLRAQVSVTEPDDLLRPGMLCRAEVYSPGDMDTATSAPAPAAGGETSDSVLIPREALAGEDRVWVVTINNKLESRQITRDPSRDKGDRIAVTGGLLPGEPVVLAPSADFKADQNVKAQ